jgi:hypothetical protein
MQMTVIIFGRLCPLFYYNYRGIPTFKWTLFFPTLFEWTPFWGLLNVHSTVGFPMDGAAIPGEHTARRA